MLGHLLVGVREEVVLEMRRVVSVPASLRLQLQLSSWGWVLFGLVIRRLTPLIRMSLFGMMDVK